jgi:hypothetical protein
VAWEERTKLAEQNQTSSHFWFTVKGTIQNDIIVPVQDKTSTTAASSEAFSTTHILFVGVPQFACITVNDILTVSLDVEDERILNTAVYNIIMPKAIQGLKAELGR